MPDINKQPIWTSLGNFYLRVVNSIAFLPSLISIIFLLFSIGFFYLEYQDLGYRIKEVVEIFLVKGMENARLVMATIIGGMISLTVFSFSMVMIVLNRASASLTPRLIPGLISNKSHQVVLGFYLGTIVYSLVLIVNINPADSEIPRLGIFVSMLLTITCLGLFIYFIHSISNAIQVDKIMGSLYIKTLSQLAKQQRIPEGMVTFPADHQPFEWHDVKNESLHGYFRGLNEDELVRIAAEHNIVLKLKVRYAEFVAAGEAFLLCNADLDHAEALRSQVFSCFRFEIEEYGNNHFLYGFKQISEIAVKALSPGINDPGTAIKAIDMLTLLLIRKIHTYQSLLIPDTAGLVRVILREVPLDYLIYEYMQPILIYGKSDPKIIFRLLDALQDVIRVVSNQSEKEELMEAVRSVTETGNANLNNSYDRARIAAKVLKIRKLVDAPQASADQGASPAGQAGT